MIVKAGLGLLGLGAISVGGVALSNPSLFGIGNDDSPVPNFHNLSDDDGFSATYNTEDKFGKKYGKYFVGATHKQGKQAETNKDWWEWALKRLQDNRPKNGKFKTIDKWYETSGTSALNKVCEEAYKKNEADLKEDSDNNEANFKKSEVWKYCSIGGTQPQTIDEFNTNKNEDEKEKYSESNAIGNMSDQKSKLLSINSEANKWIWDLKDKEFESTNITGDSYFKSEKDKTGDEKKTIKEICKGAYKKQENSTGSGAAKITKTDTSKYCSLEQMNAS